MVENPGIPDLPFSQLRRLKRIPEMTARRLWFAARANTGPAQINPTMRQINVCVGKRTMVRPSKGRRFRSAAALRSG